MVYEKAKHDSQTVSNYFWLTSNSKHSIHLTTQCHHSKPAVRMTASHSECVDKCFKLLENAWPMIQKSKLTNWLINNKQSIW